MSINLHWGDLDAVKNYLAQGGDANAPKDYVNLVAKVQNRKDYSV